MSSQASLPFSALYAFSGTLRGQPAVVSCALCFSIAVVIWKLWDPSRPALLFALAASVLGPLLEIAMVAAGLIAYAADTAPLFGVAPWLPAVYFAEAAVASGLWSPIAGHR